MLVFAYGTLRRHERYHHLLAGAELVAEQSWTEGALFDTDQGYPALKDGSQDTVFGELYRIDEDILQKLDTLEGYRGQDEANLYNRSLQTVYTDGGTHKAVVYKIHPNHESMLKHPVPYGDWKVEQLLKSSGHLFYFAYGSCMDHERFRLAGVDQFFQKVKGRGVLDGYQLRYTRRLKDGARADIVEADGTVEGIVYEVPNEAVAYLFKREGVNSGNYRPAVVDVTVDGKLLHDVLTFIVVGKDEESAPPLHYATEIIRGGSEWLSAEYINKLKKQLKEQFDMSL